MITIKLPCNIERAVWGNHWNKRMDIPDTWHGVGNTVDREVLYPEAMAFVFRAWHTFSLSELLATYPLGTPSAENPWVSTVVDQTPSPSFDVKVWTFGYRLKGKNLNFKKRAAAGEIIVRPMAISDLKIHGIPIATTNDTRRQGTDQILSYWTTMEQLPTIGSIEKALPPPAPNVTCRLVRNPPYWYHAFDGWMPVVYGTVQFDIVDAQYPGTDVVTALAEKIHAKARLDVPDTALVTDVLAKANTGDWDLLTELMELPDTVKWIEDLLKKVGYLINVFRGKHNSVMNTFHWKESKLRRPEPPIGRNDPTTYANLKRTKAQRKIERDNWNKYRRELREYKRNRKVNYLEMVDALASLRLQVEYAIKPLIFSLQDYLKALKNVDREYGKFTAYKRYEETITDHYGFKGKITFKVEERAWLKRRYEAATFLEGMLNRVSFSVGVTALELVPYLGIIINWFFNVGDFLSAYSFNIAYAEQKATYSKKVTVSGSLEHTVNGTIQVPQSRIYEVKIISPTDHIACRPVDNFSFQKAINAFALGWVALRSSVSTPIGSTR